MFKLQQTSPTFKARVGISIAGQARQADIEVEFRYLKKKQVKDFFENMQGKTDVEALGEIIVGWSGVDQPYSSETLEMLLDEYPAAAADLFESFRRELLDARRKN